jgi:hypothetical protein
MIVEDSEKLPKVASKFYCYVCDYNTSKKSSYDKHLSTDKHKNNENDSKMVVEDSEKSPKVAKYECECGKIYKYDSGYYRHKKNCLGENVIIDNDVPTDKELILMLIKQNSQLIQQNSDLVKNGTHNTTISNNTNSHNKTFNMQFFLNETCKDAMNIMDFVNSIKIQLCDLENVGKVGFVDGISSIIVKNLNLLDETKRPVHCADTKREVMYVKDENKWEKEDEDKKKIRKMIKYVTHKNTKLMKEFREKYPGCEKSESKYSNSYDKLIIEAFGGKGDNDEEKENKIIRKISKATTIDKNV